MSLQRVHSATTQTEPLPPLPPALPYISPLDQHLGNFFTKERIKKHLRQASLLSKDGHIITEAEYESKQTDIAIGRENQRKRDDAILEVLNKLGEQHNKLENNRLETVKDGLLCQFRRIEEQYSRRVQPIMITVTHEGRVEQKPVIPRKPPVQIVKKAPVKADYPILPPIIASPNFSNELENIRQKLDELTNHQSMLDHKLNTLSGNNRSNALLWTIQHTMNQLKEKQDDVEKQQETWQQARESEEKARTREVDRQFDLLRHLDPPSTIDQQQIEQLIRTSTVIRNLDNSISNIHKLLAVIPTNITQATIDAAIATSERRIIEQLGRDVGDKFHQLEAKIAELKALPTPITRIDVENLIRDAMRTGKPIEPNNSESATLGRAMNDRITQLEKQLNDFSQSINSCVTRPTVEDLIRQAISDNQLTPSQTLVTSQPDISLQKRITLIEQRLDTFPPVGDLRQIQQRLTPLENRASEHIHNVPLVEAPPSFPPTESVRTNTVYVEDPRIIPLEIQVKSHAGSLQDLHETIKELKRTRIDFLGVQQLVNASEEKPRQAVDELAKYVHHECQDARLPDVINTLNNHSTLIKNLSSLTSDLDRNKPDLKTVERLIRDSEARIVGTTTSTVDGGERPDPRIPGLQTQIDGHSKLIENLEKRLEQFQQTKPDQQVVQQLIDESERRKKAAIDNLPLPAHQESQDSRFSVILQQVNGHTVSIQDLNNRINQLPNNQPNDELHRKVDDNEREVKRAHTDLAALRRQLAQQPTPTLPPSLPQPPLPLQSGKDSLTRQYTDEDFQAIMPFIELLPMFNLFAENEWA